MDEKKERKKDNDRKEEPEVMAESDYKRKLDPQIASILSWPQDVIEEIKKTENRFLDERLEDLYKRIITPKEPRDYTEEPDYDTDVEDKATVKGVPRQVRARLLQFASLLHSVDFDAEPEPTVSVFIKFRGDVNRFEKFGVKIRSVAGDIATATVPLKGIPNLETDEDVIYIELSRPAFPDLDESVPILQADQLHAAIPPITGQGTIVGIVDYGIDFYHPDFRDPVTNDTRLIFLWHQDPPPGTSGKTP